MTEYLRIRFREVLYRTRGRDWDYAFLLQPEPLFGEGWYQLHRRIFANVEPTSVPTVLRGALGLGTGHPFFACTFTDGRRRDHQGRPIAHYVVWLGPAAHSAPSCTFGPALIEALRDALDSVFEVAPETIALGETKPLDALLRARFSRALPGDEASVRCPATDQVLWLGALAPYT